MESTPWQRAAATAARQFGVVSSAQLVEGGFSRSGISRQLACGRLVRLHRGVYGLGHAPTDHRTPLFAATLLAGPGAALADHSAGSLLGMSANRTGRIWVAAPGRRRAVRGKVTIRDATFGPGEVGFVRGLRCTTPSRTILDLAAIAVPLAERAVKGAGDAGLLDVDSVLSLLERHPGQRGAARLRTVLFGCDRLPVFTRSELERRLYRLCKRYVPELPDMNVEIAAGGRVYECDAVWPEFRLIVECDSRWHDNPVTAREDAERDERLTLAGWRVFRLRWGQIALRPERTAATINHLIESQRRLLGMA